jgi:Uma2 family endonuclease
MPKAASGSTALESGDHLTRVEFHRRYCARPDIKRAELVEGVVYVSSPVADRLARPHAIAIGWLFMFWEHHPELNVSDNVTVILDGDNEVQPDACLWREDPNGPHVDDDGYIRGAPQLIVEVAASSASYDMHEKLRAYRRNGVQEYVVWRVLDEEVSWFRLEEGDFVLVGPDAAGIIESAAFPGLRLHIAHLIAGNLAGLRQAMPLD